jgi:hypothetical protein
VSRVAQVTPREDWAKSRCTAKLCTGQLTMFFSVEAHHGHPFLSRTPFYYFIHLSLALSSEPECAKKIHGRQVFWAHFSFELTIICTSFAPFLEFRDPLPPPPPSPFSALFSVPHRSNSDATGAPISYATGHHPPS